MSAKRYLLSLLILSVSWCIVSANGDPVVKYSSINRVANPQPLNISEIEIINEKIKITHVDGYNCFDITYQFQNKSHEKIPEIHYGFPIDYLISDELETLQMVPSNVSESMYETGWNDNLIKDISFVFNQDTLQFHAAKETVVEAGFEPDVYSDNPTDSCPTPGINRRWFYTNFWMNPTSTATLNVKYKVYSKAINSLYNYNYASNQYSRETKASFNIDHPFLLRYLNSCFTILYDFKPAKHFGNNKSFSLYVDIDLSNLDSPSLNIGEYTCYSSHLTRYIHTKADNIKPINLTIRHTTNKSEEDIEQIIAPFIISNDKYEVRQNKKNLEIIFKNPTFVSELVCDLDTTLIRSINSTVTFANGRKEDYRYKKNDRPPEHNPNIKTPPILVITDLIYDSFRYNKEIEKSENITDIFDSSYFKIKKIILNFDTITEKLDQLPCSNIKLLDSRFGKTQSTNGRGSIPPSEPSVHN